MVLFIRCFSIVISGDIQFHENALCRSVRILRFIDIFHIVRKISHHIIDQNRTVLIRIGFTSFRVNNISLVHDTATISIHPLSLSSKNIQHQIHTKRNGARIVEFVTELRHLMPIPYPLLCTCLRNLVADGIHDYRRMVETLSDH